MNEIFHKIILILLISSCLHKTTLTSVRPYAIQSPISKNNITNNAISAVTKATNKPRYLNILDDAEQVYLKTLMIIVLFARDVDKRYPKKSQTLLHWSVLTNQLDAVKLLISINADVNITDRYGCTPLRYVNKYNIAQELIKAKADANGKDDYSKLPIQLTSNISVAKLLFDKMNQQNLDRVLGYTIIFSFTDDEYKIQFVDDLLRSGANFIYSNELICKPLWKESDVLAFQKIIKSFEFRITTFIINYLKIPKALAKIIAQYNYHICYTIGDSYLLNSNNAIVKKKIIHINIEDYNDPLQPFFLDEISKRDIKNPTDSTELIPI